MAHPYETLEYEGEPVRIDQRMVPFITALWALGIRTNNCCQGDDGDDWHSAYVSVPMEDFRKFFDLLGSHLEIAQANRRHNKYFGSRGIHEEDLPESLDAVFHVYSDGRSGPVDAVLRFLPARLPELTRAADSLASAPA